MKHLSDEDIMLLAEVVEEQLILSKDQLGMMEHLKTCRSCYEKFCSASALYEVTSVYSYPVLSKIYGVGRAKSLAEQAREKTLAVVNLVRDRISDTMGAVLEQIDREGDTFRFRPSVAMATRGAAEAVHSVYIVEDINDDKTFIAIDPVRNELLLQINAKDLGNAKIRAYFELESGECIAVHMESKGKVYKGRTNCLPKDNARLVIKSQEYRNN